MYSMILILQSFFVSTPNGTPIVQSNIDHFQCHLLSSKQLEPTDRRRPSVVMSFMKSYGTVGSLPDAGYFDFLLICTRSKKLFGNW